MSLSFVTAKGFYSLDSATDCDTEEPCRVRIQQAEFFSVYKVFVTQVEQSETL